MKRQNTFIVAALAFGLAIAILPSLANAGGSANICDITPTSFEMWLYQLLSC